jgi:hypothetical protein
VSVTATSVTNTTTTFDATSKLTHDYKNSRTTWGVIIKSNKEV